MTVRYTGSYVTDLSELAMDILSCTENRGKTIDKQDSTLPEQLVLAQQLIVILDG